MKKKWYLQTWLICILFSLWFVYGIPTFLGIILLVLKLKQEKIFYSQYEQLSTEVNKMKELLTPEMQDAHALQNLINSLHAEEATAKMALENTKKESEKAIGKKESELNKLDKQIAEKKKKIIWMDDEILVQEFGLYEPQFDFASALGYKESLIEVRAQQKQLIKDKKAVSGNTQWQVNGSAAKGKKMVSDTQKLLLRAFNVECDELVSKVKYTNFDSYLERIYKSAEAISKLGTVMNISITQQYLSAKVKELHLAFEYQQKRQEEKENQKALRAEMREAARIQKEIEEQRKLVEKEQTHYQTALEKIHHQLQNEPDNQNLLEKQRELENHLSDIDHSLKQLDYRTANQKAGYVYVISNIGSFGKDVYKIGMTRRLEPQERIDELGDASVPFNFDVHAMIFSDDAPALEAALHRAFEDKKLNMVNHRREFFHVTLEEIKEVIRKNFDKTVEFIDTPDAEQYRISQEMKIRKSAGEG